MALALPAGCTPVRLAQTPNHSARPPTTALPNQALSPVTQNNDEHSPARAS